MIIYVQTLSVLLRYQRERILACIECVEFLTSKRSLSQAILFMKLLWYCAMITYLRLKFVVMVLASF